MIALTRPLGKGPQPSSPFVEQLRPFSFSSSEGTKKALEYARPKKLGMRSQFPLLTSRELRAFPVSPSPALLVYILAAIAAFLSPSLEISEPFFKKATNHNNSFSLSEGFGDSFLRALEAF